MEHFLMFYEGIFLLLDHQPVKMLLLLRHQALNSKPIVKGEPLLPLLLPPLLTGVAAALVDPAPMCLHVA